MPTFSPYYIKSQRPKEKKYRVSEGRGFILQILPSGVKTFYFRHDVKGVRKELPLGVYETEVSIEEARTRFNAARDAYDKGLDPKAAVEALVNPPAPAPIAPPAEVVPEGEMTLQQLLDEYIPKWSEKKHSKRYSYNNRRCLEKDLMPEWGDKPITAFKPKHAYKLIDHVGARAPGTARNIIKAASKMFDYAIKMEYAEFNPFRLKFNEHTPEIIPKVGERTLSEEEIRFIWKAIDEGPGTNEVKRAIKLVLVTAQRPGEVAGMLHSEIEGDWWTIPWERIKTEKKKGLPRKPRPHLVYLTPLAKSLIGEPGWSGDVVFPVTRNGIGERKDGKPSKRKKDITPVDANALNKRVSRQDTSGRGINKKVTKKPYYGLPRWTPHDLRRTADTMMNAIKIDHRHVEMVLNHSLGKVEGTYNKYMYADEKMVALIRWEEKLKEILGM